MRVAKRVQTIRENDRIMVLFPRAVFFNAEALGRDGTAGARRGGKGVLLVHYGGYVDISTLRRIRIFDTYPPAYMDPSCMVLHG